VSGKRQKTEQLQLAFMSDSRSEAPRADVQGTELPTAKRPPESPAGTEQERLGESKTRSNRRVRTRTHGGLAGTAREGLPMPIDELATGGLRPRRNAAAASRLAGSPFEVARWYRAPLCATGSCR
jgi:hypothetical protein